MQRVCARIVRRQLRLQVGDLLREPLVRRGQARVRLIALVCGLAQRADLVALLCDFGTQRALCLLVLGT